MFSTEKEIQKMQNSRISNPCLPLTLYFWNFDLIIITCSIKAIMPTAVMNTKLGNKILWFMSNFLNIEYPTKELKGPSSPAGKLKMD